MECTMQCALQAHADINGDAKVDHVLASGRGLDTLASAADFAAGAHDNTANQAPHC